MGVRMGELGQTNPPEIEYIKIIQIWCHRIKNLSQGIRVKL